MRKPCDDIGRFLEGALPDAEAEDFRMHLPDCAQCQPALIERLQRDAQAALRRSRAGRPQVRWSRRAIGGSALAAAAILAVVAVGVRRPPGARNLYRDGEPTRPLEARVTYASSDRYRPPPPMTMGSDNATPPPPLKQLGELEEEGKNYELGLAYLVHHRPQDALLWLTKLESSPSADNEQAVALLDLREYDAALRSLERVLDKQPQHPQALWNRALVLRDLKLPLAAARAFEAVAALKEPGWSQEAADKARALSAPGEEERARWKAFNAACQEMVATGKVSDILNGNSPPVLRHYFYQAIYASPTPERVRALLPLARELDRVAGGTVLADYVNRIAARDFSKRSVLAKAFQSSAQHPTQAPEAAQLVEDARRSGEEDLLLGAIIRGGLAQKNLDELRRLAQDSKDPWFQAVSLEEDAVAALLKGDTGKARQLFEEGIRVSKQRVPYRWMRLESFYVELLTNAYQLEAAAAHASEALAQARALKEWTKEFIFLENLAEVATFKGSPALARAYLEEALERIRGNVLDEKYIYESQARLERDRLRLAAAREALDRAIATGLPIQLSTASVIGDVARYRVGPNDEAAILKASEDNDRRLLWKHALGKLYLTLDPPRGRALLEEVIREADPEALRGDTTAIKARAYSYGQLIMELGKEHKYDAALHLLGLEARADFPSRCAVGIAEETERSFWIVRGADGATQGQYEGARTARLPEDLKEMLPRVAVDSLRRCDQVVVFARAPLYGRAGLLPPDFVWSYRYMGARPAAPAAPSSPKRLVVADVQIDKRWNLPEVTPWPADDGSGTLYLRLGQATPERVLEEMPAVTELLIVTHGALRTPSGTAALVLALGRDGDELTTEHIRKAKLQGAPLVSLIACSAGHTAAALHEPYNMPAAFLEAGARGVFAATVKIPDQQAYKFFKALHRRVFQDGSPPAAALRDERMKWLNDAQAQGHNNNDWVRNVLLFD